MGAADDPRAVTDGKGRVHGVGGLRVVDASIMPRIVNGNLNAPTIMIAEKIADAIRGRDPLAPSSAPYWVAAGAPVRRSRGARWRSAACGRNLDAGPDRACVPLTSASSATWWNCPAISKRRAQ